MAFRARFQAQAQQMGSLEQRVHAVPKCHHQQCQSDGQYKTPAASVQHEHSETVVCCFLFKPLPFFFLPLFHLMSV